MEGDRCGGREDTGEREGYGLQQRLLAGTKLVTVEAFAVTTELPRRSGTQYIDPRVFSNNYTVAQLHQATLRLPILPDTVNV